MTNRAEQRAELAAATEAARHGIPQVVLIDGELGIGKSWEVREALSSLADFELRTVECDPAGQSRPLSVINQLIGSSTAEPISDLLRELRSRGDRPPLCLVIEDAQWCDAESADALASVFRRLRAGRVLVIVTARNATSSLAIAVARLLADNGRGLHLHLGGLGGSEVTKLLAEQAVTGLSAWAIDRLTELTDGNPLHVITTVRDLGARLRVSVPRYLPPLPGYAAELARSLEPLSVEGRTLLDLLAVAGEPISVSVMLAVANEVGRPISFDDALRSGLIDTINRAGQREVTITSARARETLRGELPAVLRRALHAALARALTGPSHLRHLLAATEFTDESVAGELIEEAERLIALGDYAMAAYRLGQAAGVSTSAEDRCARALRAGLYGFLANDVEFVTSIGPTIEAGPPCLEGELILCGFEFLRGDFARSARRLERAARNYAEEIPRNGTLLAVMRASLLLADGSPEDALRACDAQRIDPDAEGPLVARAHLLTAWSLWFCARTDESRSILQPLIDGPSAPERAEANILLGQLDMSDGAPTTARARLSTAVREAEGLSAAVLQSALCDRALIDYFLGQWTHAESDADRALRISADTGSDGSDAVAHLVLAMVAAGRGDLDAAEDELRIADAVIGARPVRQHIQLLAIATAVLERTRDDPAAVILALRPLLDDVRSTLPEIRATAWQALAAEAFIRADRLDEAEEQIERLRAESPTTGFGSVPWLEGLAAEARGEEEEALARYRDAASDERGDIAPLARLAALQAYGQLLGRTGSTMESAKQLRLAGAAIRRLGIRRSRSTRETAPLPLAPLSHWNSLTGREREVAFLAARGRLNREIAQELFLSVKTVESHLSKAMTKLGVASRRELQGMEASADASERQG